MQCTTNKKKITEELFTWMENGGWRMENMSELKHFFDNSG